MFEIIYFSKKLVEIFENEREAENLMSNADKMVIDFKKAFLRPKMRVFISNIFK